jgi:hypothetical protein
MIADENELRVSLQQMQNVIQALDDLRETVLPANPELFAVMSEGYIDQIARIRDEIDEYLFELKPAG